MSKDKHGKHKESCKKYQAEGRRERNKALKQERHKRRMEYFAKRREDGLNYEYNPDGAKSIIRHFKVTEAEDSRAESIGEARRLAKVFGKLDHYLSQERERARAEEIKNRKNKKAKKTESDTNVAV